MRPVSVGASTGLDPRSPVEHDRGGRKGQGRGWRLLEFALPFGAIAQLVERFHGMEEVWSSILHSSTRSEPVFSVEPSGRWLIRWPTQWGCDVCRKVTPRRRPRVR